MSCSSLLGWELVHAAHKSDLTYSNDIVVLAIHWRLLARGLRCVGSGEHFGLLDEKLSELLPQSWKELADAVYALKYRLAEKPTEKFLLKLVKADELVIASLIRIADEKVTTLTVNTADVTADGKSLKDQVEFAKKVDAELLEPMFGAEKMEAGPAKEAAPKKDRRDDEDPLRVGPPRYPNVPDNQPRFPGQGGPPFFDPVGGSDLDPLGRLGGGGMLFEQQGGRGGRGMARFDPVNPYFPNPSGGHRRNFGDEMPPPGFDDMFG